MEENPKVIGPNQEELGKKPEKYTRKFECSWKVATDCIKEWEEEADEPLVGLKGMDTESLVSHGLCSPCEEWMEQQE